MTRQGKQGHTSDGNTPSSPVGTDEPDHPIGARRARDFTLMAHEHVDAPEAEYTDAACIPYSATAFAIGEESIYGLHEGMKSAMKSGTPTIRGKLRYGEFEGKFGDTHQVCAVRHGARGAVPEHAANSGCPRAFAA